VSGFLLVENGWATQQSNKIPHIPSHIFFRFNLFIVIGDKALVDSFSGAITAHGIFLF
jgi:hypothetical protein